MKFTGEDSPSLVEVDQEHCAVSEAGDPVGSWHGDDDGKRALNGASERLEKEHEERRVHQLVR